MPATAAPVGRLYDHEKLRAWRVESRLTITEAAHAAGMSYPTLCKLELGKHSNPTVSALSRLALLYGHAPAELLPGLAA